MPDISFSKNTEIGELQAGNSGDKGSKGYPGFKIFMQVGFKLMIATAIINTESKATVFHRKTGMNFLYVLATQPSSQKSLIADTETCRIEKKTTFHEHSSLNSISVDVFFKTEPRMLGLFRI